ncbi:DUF6668 family protein [Yinghuangia aomiensis]
MSRRANPNANPWVPSSASAEPAPRPKVVAAAEPRVTAITRGLVAPVSGEGLPLWRIAPAIPVPPWWWVACHGGAGATTLATILGGGDTDSRGWPIHVDGSRPGVVLVARTNATGLRDAQHAARQWASDSLGAVRLWGLVAVADAPGPLPEVLGQRLHVVGGGFPRVWLIPWNAAWRLGQGLTLPEAPPQLSTLAGELRQAAARAAAPNTEPSRPSATSVWAGR